MLGPVSAYQVQQQNVQSAQVRNPNAQPSLAQERNSGRAERLNETRQPDEPAAQSNAPQKQDNFAQDAKLLISQGQTERGSLLDLTV